MAERILITGGCGFIGHHLVVELRKRGEDVVIMDSLTFNIKRPVYNMFIRQRMELLEKTGYPIVIADTRDVAAVERVFREYQPKKIVHMAAIPSAAEVTQNPVWGFDNNLTATRNMLEAARAVPDGVERFIYFSSSMVYGEFREESVTEETVCEPINIYGASKLSSEYLVKAYHNTFDIPYVIIRPSALYGPRCVNRRVSQLFIEAALLGEPLQIMDDGSDRLDFTFVNDLVEGVSLCIFGDRALNQTLNMTYGESRTILELLGILKSRFPDVKTTFRKRDKTIPRRGTLSVGRAREVIGYSPGHNLEKGYSKYIDWYLSNGLDRTLRAEQKG